MNSPAAPEWRKAREVLLSAVRSGNEAVMRHFYSEHFQTVYRYVLNRLNHAHTEAEEVVSDVFFQAFRDIERYDGEHAPGAWLQGIARHRVLDAHRRQRRHLEIERLEREAAAETHAGVELASFDAPDGWAEKAETRQAVAWVLSAQPPEYEEVLRLHYVQELPVREIAQQLGITFQAAESRLFRAREAFRSDFRRLMPSLAAEHGSRAAKGEFA